jgi:haloalkane dehalogenase
MGPGHPSWNELRSIEAGLSQFADRPTLILWGDRDFCFTPAFRQEWQRRFPSAETHAFADAGHYVVEDAVARIVPILQRFLARSP